jgi:Leucine-rich repeat (LRR) protein
MKFNIDTYLNSLSEDIEVINVSLTGITSLPSLKKFKKLKKLECNNNKLTSLPHLNETLELLNCRNNQLTSLPPLNEKLEKLYCSNNKLTSLPPLNENLEILSCFNNNLICLPSFNNNLKILFCTVNPIWEIIKNNNFNIIKIKVQILNNFRYLYYSLKFKKRFRDWLWVRVREPKIRKKYHPNYLIENLHENTDLDEVLQNW